MKDNVKEIIVAEETIKALLFFTKLNTCFNYVFFLAIVVIVIKWIFF